MLTQAFKLQISIHDLTVFVASEHLVFYHCAFSPSCCLVLSNWVLPELEPLGKSCGGFRVMHVEEAWFLVSLREGFMHIPTLIDIGRLQFTLAARLSRCNHICCFNPVSLDTSWQHDFVRMWQLYSRIVTAMYQRLGRYIIKLRWVDVFKHTVAAVQHAGLTGLYTVVHVMECHVSFMVASG